MALQNVYDAVNYEMRERIFKINLLSPMELTRLIIPSMIRGKNGIIINISSVWGQVGASCEVDYSATKAAIIGFTKALSMELAPSGINVNCIAPGVIDTNMNKNLDEASINQLKAEIPLGYIGDVKDISSTAVFLASSKASYITGQVISVNGGMLI